MPKSVSWKTQTGRFWGKMTPARTQEMNRYLRGNWATNWKGFVLSIVVRAVLIVFLGV